MLWYPAIPWLVLAVFCAIGIVWSEFAIATTTDVVATAVAIGAITGLLAVFAACEAAYLWVCLGSVVYRFDGWGVVVERKHAVLHAWAWQDIDLIRMEGGYGWREVFTPRVPTEFFPYLLVHSRDRVTHCPGLLLWGRGHVSTLESAVQEQRARATGRRHPS